ncbi:hypothetical protein ACFVXE_37900 [Streptomyces sp. NPDC058231]|uniref:hypothetical protein n=1 Tax=Streptomyces sp. NPDC058231 TaxID=3346392 RepID=UPI0036E07BA7
MDVIGVVVVGDCQCGRDYRQSDPVGEEVQPGAAGSDRRREGTPSFVVSHELSLDEAQGIGVVA